MWNLGFGLEDRGVIVTGAAGAIGRTVAQGFARAGARVVAVDRTAAEAAEVIAELEQPARHLAIGADITVLGEHERIFSTAHDELGEVVALAHLAAIFRRRATIDDVTEADWDLQHDTNLKSTFFLNRTAAHYFQANRPTTGGAIVNFSSQSWWSGGFAGAVVYAASKAGVVAMSRGLARSLAPDQIRVNTVAPGFIDSPMLREGATEADMTEYLRMTPLGRLAQPEELAAIVVFLCSDHARYITGATMNVTGGQLMY